MKIELRTKTETFYIANDGKEFTTKADCMRYEENKLVSEMREYFEKHGEYFYEGYEGIPGYMGVCSYSACLIKLDDTVYNWLDYMNRACDGKHYLFSKEYMPKLEEMRGEVVLFQFPSFDDFYEWYILGTKKEIAERMCDTIDWLNNFNK